MERHKKLSSTYKVFIKTTGIYVVATKLICADGTEQLHAIYLDCERYIVHFGYNDYGDDMISLECNVGALRRNVAHNMK